MGKSIFVLVVMLISYKLGIAQYSLKGKVIASDTRNPVISANVFLSNTSIGTISDQSGTFIITRFPPGRFELVVSCIGFETYTIPVQSHQLPVDLEIILKPKVTELEEVIVEPYEKDGWEKWGNVFIEHFLGTSRFAEDIRLLNSEVLKFRFSKKRNVLKVFSDERILIENKGLGYLLKYDLTRFEFDFTNRLFFYQGFPFFEEMKTDRQGMQKRWSENRKEAYFGSLMHFMRSLYRNILIEQGFEVRQWILLTEGEKQRVKQNFGELLKDNQFLTYAVGSTEYSIMGNKDSISYFKQVIQQAAGKNMLLTKILSADSICYAVDSTSVALDFVGHLEVRYPDKTFPAEYGRSIIRMMARSSAATPLKRGAISSGIFLNVGNPVVVFANGTYANGYNLVTSDYWAWWEKMANKLPYEYWPPKKESPNR